MENKNNIFLSIEMSDIVFWFMKWKWIIVVASILSAILGYVLSNFTYSPVYTAKASMVVNSKQAKIVEGEVILPNDIYLAQQLMSTYTSVLTSDKIASYVMDMLDIEGSAEAIRNSVKITSAEQTQVVYIEVTNKEPYMAKNIANAIMEVAPQVMKETVEVGNVNILDYAKLPTEPNSPLTIQYIIIAGILGFLLSTSAVVLVNFVTMKVKNMDDIESKTDLPVFGEIPHASVKADREKTYLYTGQANTAFTESYFMAGAVLKNYLEDKRPYKIIITSSVAGEGKTTTSINVVTVLADMGHKVLLVDLDMKKPNVAKQLNYDIKNKGGIEKVIEGEPVESHIIKSDYGFDFIPCTKSVKNTSKLLSSIRLEMFFKELDNTDYDYIIIDTAPAHIIADTSVIVRYADGLLMVIKQHFARLKVIMDTISNLKKSGANIIGSVLNDVRVYNIGTGYAYKYKYGYYYKGSYGRSGYGEYSYGEVQDDENKDNKDSNANKKEDK